MKKLLLFILVLFLISCSGKRYKGVLKIKHPYPMYSENKSAEFKLYHAKDSSMLYFRTPVEDVKTRIKIVQYNDFNKKLLIDSVGFNVLASGYESGESKIMQGAIDLKTNMSFDQQSLLELYVQRKDPEVFKRYIYCDTLLNAPANYVLYDERNQVIFKNYVNDEQKHFLYSEKYKEKPVVISKYKVSDKLPKPPFSAYVPPPDSQIPLSIDTLLPNKNRYEISCVENTFVVVKAFSSSDVRASVFYFDKNYPNVKDVEVMVDALRYITTEEEYEIIQESENKKAAIDDFWLSCSGSKERARKLIKNYYGRVEYSNRYFTSHVPGWKSDRGLIYVIYGPPRVIFVGNNREIWDYGDQNSFDGVSFEFLKIDNPYVNTDYRLVRNEEYKSSWYRAVGAWREGRMIYE